MIDPKFTEKIALWLRSDHKDDEKIKDGAMLLLQLNRDQAMYQRIVRHPQRELKFLEYKLQRFLRLRKDGKTIRDVITLDREVTPGIAAAVSADTVTSDVGTLPVVNPAEHDGNSVCVVHKGIRPDHDKLPANIQAIWTKNTERWKKIKEAFEACKQLTEPCDRYEYLKVLKETWYKYKEEMARYDEYHLTEDGGIGGDGADNQTLTLTPEQEKELKNADSYISKNMPQMQQLVAAAKEDEFNDDQKKQLESLRNRIQQRVDILLRYGRSLTDERREQLLQCDIRVTPEIPEVNEQGQESE